MSVKSTIQYAEWRVVPKDPRWVRKAVQIVALAGLISITFLAMVRVPSPFHLIFQSLITVVTIVGLRSYTISGARRELPPRSEPDPHDSIPVHMTTFLGDDFVGRDVGWLTVVDGWLIFEGRATHFSIKSSVMDRLVPGNGFVRLRYTGPSGSRRSVAFLPLDRKAKINRVVEGWWRDLVPEGATIMPPLDSNRSVWLDLLGGWTAISLVIGIGLLASGALIDLILPSEFGPIPGSMQIGLGFLSASPIFALVQHRSIRRRLDRELESVGPGPLLATVSEPLSDGSTGVLH